MILTKNLSKSQLESIALHAYNNAIDDMINAGIIESRKEVMTNSQVKDLKEETIQLVAKCAMQRYEQKG